jgi:hypothetical protein
LVLPLLAASVAWAQVPLTESDLEWRKSPRPAIESQDRKHTPATLPDNSSDPVTPIWSIETADTTLSNTLSRWSRQEKWQLLWEADRDFPILATVYLKGSFQSAILSVMQSLSDSDYHFQKVFGSPLRLKTSLSELIHG